MTNQSVKRWLETGPSSKPVNRDWWWWALAGALMVISAFVGWAHFIPVVGNPSTTSNDFVSSPIGLGTDPLKVGGYLMVVCGVVLFGRGYILKRRGGRNPLFSLVIVVVVIVAYIAISIATWFEIRPWTQTVLTQKFTSPSGRVLFPLNSAPGYGAGFCVLAIAISILATILFCIEARGAIHFGHQKSNNAGTRSNR
jgi:hypothetical protein